MDHNNKLLPEVIEVKTTNGTILIKPGKILYIKAERKFSVIVFDDKSSIIVFHMLKWFEKFLHPPCFCRSHYSYLVNCCHVHSIDHSRIILNGKISIPVSRKKIDQFKETLKNFHKVAS